MNMLFKLKRKRIWTLSGCLTLLEHVVIVVDCSCG